MSFKYARGTDAGKVMTSSPALVLIADVDTFCQFFESTDISSSRVAPGCTEAHDRSALRNCDPSENRQIKLALALVTDQDVCMSRSYV